MIHYDANGAVVRANVPLRRRARALLQLELLVGEISDANPQIASEIVVCNAVFDIFRSEFMNSLVTFPMAMIAAPAIGIAFATIPIPSAAGPIAAPNLAAVAAGTPNL